MINTRHFFITSFLLILASSSWAAADESPDGLVGNTVEAPAIEPKSVNADAASGVPFRKTQSDPDAADLSPSSSPDPRLKLLPDKNAQPHPVNCQAPDIQLKIKKAKEINESKTVAYPLTTLDQFDDLWKVWQDSDEKDKVSKMKPADRRKAVGEHYGLFTAPGGTKPLGLTATDGEHGKKAININCYSCHANRLNGQVIYGAMNTKFDMQSYVEDVLKTVAVEIDPKKPVDRFSKLTKPDPANLTVGRFNENELITVIAAAFRDPKTMDLVTPSQDVLNATFKIPKGDITSQPLWRVGMKNAAGVGTFIDGSIPPDLMRRHADLLADGATIPGLGTHAYSGAELRNRAADLELLPYLSICQEAPDHNSPAMQKIIRPFDEKKRMMANRGKYIYETMQLDQHHPGQTCASCHGKYDGNGQLAEKFPGIFVGAKETGTDANRLLGADPKLNPLLHQFYSGWIAEGTKGQVGGKDAYLAAPLTGVGYSPPYLHNGSVPSLWYLLNPKLRPEVWTQVEGTNNYDEDAGGLKVKTMTLNRFKDFKERKSDWKLRRYDDTSAEGASNAGHPWGENLSDFDKRALIAYLETL